jgi:hypothetical protein
MARKSFVNGSTRQVRAATRLLKTSGVLVVTGFPQINKTEGGTGLGFQKTVGLTGYGFLSGVMRFWHRGNFDYIEAGVSYRSGEHAPETFRGVSGGGIWSVQIMRKSGDALGTEYCEAPCFVGVVFYETEVKKGFRRLRAHGPRSVFRTFMPEVMRAT